MWCFVVLKNQWQAQPVAQPPEAAGVEGLLEALSVLLELVLVAILSLAVATAAVPAAGAAGADVPPEPPLKSVAYQPEPLS
jgi:hypothetical protein